MIMEPRRLPPRVASPIRDPDSLVGLQRSLESTTPPGKIQELSDHNPPCGTSTVRLSADSVEQHEENNPIDTPERQASVHHGTGIDAPLPGARLSGEDQGLRRARTTDTRPSMARRSAIDWMLPVEKVCSMLAVLF